MTVLEIIQANEDQVVEVYRKTDAVMYKSLFTGNLYDIPVDLQGLQVRETAWSLVYNIAKIEVV